MLTNFTDNRFTVKCMSTFIYFHAANTFICITEMFYATVSTFAPIIILIYFQIKLILILIEETDQLG